MASFVKKVFGLGKGRNNSPQDEQAKKFEDTSERSFFPNEDPNLRLAMAPLCPPMPDLTGLSNEEIQILSDVFRRQQQFDVETKERIKNLKIALDRYEALSAEFHQREQTGYIDLRLCQLCFRVKFADGIGRVCCDCDKRVCHRCGSFARPRWDPKRSKSIRGKWRCAQCQLRRELMCKTGTWYHGDEAGDILYNSESTAIQKQESDETIVPAVNDTLTEVSSDVFRSGVDVECSVAPPPPNSVNRRSYRTRSLPAGYSDERRDEEEVSGDTEQFETERKLLRKKRLDRKLRRRSILRNRTSTDMPEIVVNPPDETASHRPSKSRTMSGSSLPHESRRKENVERRRKEAVAGLEIEKKSPGEHETDNQNRIQRQNAICYSSSSNSVTSESKAEPAPVETGNVLEPDSLSSCKNQDAKNKYRSISLTQTRVRTLDITPVFRSSTYDVPMKRGDGLLAPDTSPNKCRRITLPLCQDLGLVAQKAKGEQANLPPSNPHEIILHRNKEDSSYRTRGLGMRVLGGKLGEDNRLGAYVRSVESGGPADLQGNIREGDQILTWDGQSLVDVTYEEAQEIMDRSGNIVQILIWHRPITEEDTVVPTAAERREKFKKADSADMELTQTKDKEFENLGFKRKRRILPKTPLEIKKDTTRVILGRLQMKINYIPDKMKLIITIMKVVNLVPPDKPERKMPSPLAMLRLLPSTCWEQFETTTILENSSPEWNETFTFCQLSGYHLKTIALEVTLWSFNKNADDTFIGEVLLDLYEAGLDDQPIWYDLEDHDENSSPLPDRTKLYPENSPMSSTSTETSRTGTPCRGSSPSPFNRSPAGSFSQRSMSVTPTHDKRKHLLSKKSPAREKLEAPVGRASPVHSPVSSEDSYVQSGIHRNSLSKKMKRKMSQAVMKVSATLAVADCRDSSESLASVRFGEPDIKIWDAEDISQPVNRSVSAGNVHALDLKDHIVRPDAQNRRSAPQLGLLAPPLSQASSISSCFVEDTSEELLSSHSTHTTPDFMQQEKTRDKPCLGPGQIQSVQPSDEDKGSLKLGFMVTKGQLEVNVIMAQGLSRPDRSPPQDTYVKTYVMQGNKVMQKKKTSINKDGADPNYREKIKYSACNALGRHMKINVWEKHKTFDKKVCLGEIVIKLENLDLSKHTIGWYQLFNSGATEMSSDETLSHW